MYRNKFGLSLKKESQMSTIVTSSLSMTFGSSRSSFSLMRTIAWVEGMAERRRSRLALAELTDGQLKDIGLSRSEAFGEVNRPFWK